MLKIAYFGTPSFSADLLEKLIVSKLADISLVVTQPDKPVGREQTITPSPVKLIAQKYHIEVFDHNDLSELPELLITKNIDFGLVFSYGKIINTDLLSSPKMQFSGTGLSFLNIHPSLLPKYRGASPIVFPLLLGDKETGVSLMVMDEKMDHGPLLAQQKLKIMENDTTQTLTVKLTNLTFDMVISIVKQLTINKKQLTITPQNHNFASFTRSLTRDDGFISLSLLQKALHREPVISSELPEIYQWYNQKNNLTPSILIHNSLFIILNMHRSLSPWPGLWTTVTVNGCPKRLILKNVASSTKSRSASGGNNKQLIISRVQLEGKKEVDFETFNKAYPRIF